MFGLATVQHCVGTLVWSGASAAVLAILLAMLPLTAWLASHRRLPGRFALLAANGGAMLWLALAALELAVPDLRCKLLVGGLISGVVVLVPSAWLIFLATHVRGTAPVGPRGATLMLGVAPALVTATALTSGLHGLFYGPATRLQDGAVVFDRGPAFWLTVAYLYALLARAGILLLRAIMAADAQQRSQLWLLLAITAVPVAGNVAYIGFGITLFDYDPTPFLFVVAVAAYLVLLLGGNALDVSVLARRQLLRALPQAVFVVTAQGELLPSNPAAERLLQGGALRDALMDRFEACRTAEDGRASAVQIGLDYFDLTVEPVRSVLGGDTAPLGWLLVAQNVSEARARERALARIARRSQAARRDAITSALQDPLTGLFNRRALTTQFDTRAAEAAQSGLPFAAVVLDIDHFKTINDTHGHDVGDMVLVSLTRALRVWFRETDGLFRIGGEEFMILASGLAEDAMLARLAAVRQKVGRAVTVQSLTVPAVTFSAGLAVYPADGTSFEVLYRAADSRLFTAKAAGRDRIVTARAQIAWTDLIARRASDAPRDAPTGPR